MIILSNLMVPFKIHWPCRIKKGTKISPENYVDPDIPATWRAMEKLYDSGKAHAIGVSNFSSKKLEDLLALARVPPAVDQVECHPFWQQTGLHTLCQSKGVHLSVSYHKGFNFVYENILF
jgi:alcohol dehydrogenase (NADP+)